MLFKTIVKFNEERLQKAIDYVVYHGNHSTYPLEIAEILLAIYPTSNALIAGILSTVFTKIDLSSTDLQLSVIANRFGVEIANIVDNIIKLSTINYLPYNTIQAQKFFNSLFSIPEEVAREVLFIKLSYLLHNISVFSVSPSIGKYTISALEIMELYVPLIARIGLEEIKIELQEICLKILRPDTREYILSHLYTISGNNVKALINKIINLLHNDLNSAGIKAKILGRIKSPYSIWLKMLQKNVSVEQLYDILAFRIIVDNVEQCYRTLAIIHNQYPLVKGQFQDYIRLPKSNGYQSLHTVIIGPTKRNIEIQIRTQEMDKTAQYGKAAHWQYKREPSIIKEKIYNIYRSLYQTAYLPLVNILRTQEPVRAVKQPISRLYKFEIKEFIVVRNINSRFSLNDNATNTYQNSSNIVFALRKPREHLDLTTNPVKPYNESTVSVLRTMFTNHQFAFHLIVNNIELSDTNQILQLNNQQIAQIAIYNYNDNTTITINDSKTSLNLKTKIEQLPAEERNKPLLITESPRQNDQHSHIKTNINNNKKDNKFNDCYIDQIEEPQTKVALQTLSVCLQNIDNKVPTLKINFSNKIDINKSDKNGHTLLKDAILSDDLKTIKYLLAHPEIDINTSILILAVCGPNNDEPFLLAVRIGNVKIIQAFLAHPQTNIRQQTQDHETALIIAAQTNKVEVLKLLVAYLQNIFENDLEQLREYINFQDRHNHTALYYAVANYLNLHEDNIEIIQTLLALKDDRGEHLVSTQEHNMFDTMLLKGLGKGYESDESSLYKVRRKLLMLKEIIHSLPTLNINFVDIIGDINKADENGNTLLKDAILRQDSKTVKSLLNWPEIDINKSTSMPAIRGVKDEDQPFLLAVGIGNIEIVQAFLAHPQINIRQQNQDHETALIIAAQTNKVEVLKLLVA
ncbi:ankyrin repeat domain-containing protein [Candidatus Tisiphia endosymbiont of Nemotelus uliginosus]|uniref:ankyrin repeat domain-containing protein n=1 Tax=Candidatus Tisiphia endosymbiont of Nemotelus uliginosus TaxID=3077926 RepID=UPI0035C8ECE2